MLLLQPLSHISSVEAWRFEKSTSTPQTECEHAAKRRAEMIKQGGGIRGVRAA